MTTFPAHKSWHAKFKIHQVEVQESPASTIWISTQEVRKVLPALRKDSELQKDLFSGILKLDKGPRHFFTEAALIAELQNIGSNDALVFLAWLEKSVFYAARRKRGETPILKAHVPQSVDFSNTQPLDGDHISHIPTVWNKAPSPSPSIPSEETLNAEDPLGHVANAPSSKETILVIWRGEASMLRTFFSGGFAMMAWTIIVSLAIYFTVDLENYSGAYRLRQWAVLLLILAAPLGGIWWSTGMIRCGLRMHRDRHHPVLAAPGFLLGLTFMFYVIATDLGVAWEWVGGWWDSVSDNLRVTEVVHDKFLGRIVIKGTIGFGSYQALEVALKQQPKLTLVEIESPGGYVSEGLAMARLIEQNKLDTVSFETCASACTLLLAAGQDRYLGNDARIGFHRSWSFRYADTGHWTSTDNRIADYYRSRSAKEDFVKQALDTPGASMWFPEHWRMYSAGYATKRWDERRAGY